MAAISWVSQSVIWAEIIRRRLAGRIKKKRKGKYQEINEEVVGEVK